jgi:hypothetical protein
MSALDLEALLQVTSSKLGIHDIACPLCGPDRNAPANRIRRVLRVWHVSPGLITYSCARCGETGHVRDRRGSRVNRITRALVQTEMAEHARAAAADRLKIGLALWRSRQPLRARSQRPICGPRAPTAAPCRQRSDFFRRVTTTRPRSLPHSVSPMKERRAFSPYQMPKSKACISRGFYPTAATATVVKKQRS